ncbi:MAG TPA: adenylate kinase [Acidimicrobiales bacterium]|nr:adenylate kinase [Acidimicrobiales bacterium]
MAAPIYVVLLGKQGAGKGTQSELLCARHGLVHLSTGDILRAAVRAGSDLGHEVSRVLEAGELVSDDLVNRLVEERLAAPDAAAGAVFDGYPRTRGQAEALDAILAPEAIGVCVLVELPDGLVVERLSARRVCEGCGTTYTATDPSAVSGVCERCGGRVVQRADDTPEAIGARLAAYDRDTRPLIDFYDARGLLVAVDGDRSVEEVSASIEAALAARGLA